MTTREPDKELIAAAAEAFREPFGAVLEVAPVEAEAFLIDGSGPAPKIIAGADKKRPAPDCRLAGELEIIKRAFAGERALESAFISGRLFIAGDISVMARLKFSARRG